MERKIISTNILIYENERQIVLECEVARFENGQVINVPGITTYWKTLYAHKNLVHPETGRELTQEELEAYKGNELDFEPIEQYEFFDNLIKSGSVNIPALKQQYILKNDLNKKFDV